MVFRFLFAIVLLFFGCSLASAQCSGGSCSSGGMMSSNVGFRGFFSPPRTMMSFQTVATPMQYQGSAVSQRQFATPVRSMLFGGSQVQHYYQPANQQPSLTSPSLQPTQPTTIQPQYTRPQYTQPQHSTNSVQVMRPAQYEVNLVMPN